MLHLARLGMFDRWWNSGDRTAADECGLECNAAASMSCSVCRLDHHALDVCDPECLLVEGELQQHD